MYILGIINQSKNFIQMLWTNNSWRSFIIYSIVFVCISMYITETLNSMIRRDTITLPPVIERVIGTVYAEKNKLYAARMSVYQREKQLRVLLTMSQQNNTDTQGAAQQMNVQQQQEQQEKQLRILLAMSQQQQMELQEQAQLQQQAQPQQQVVNRGGRKTIYTPVTALIMVMQLVAMSAICCTIIFLIYRRFTADNIPPLPILSSKGK